MLNTNVSVALAATAALLFACGAFLLWRRRGNSLSAPVLEGSAVWYPNIPGHFAFLMTVCNRAQYQIAVRRIAVFEPPGLKLVWEKEALHEGAADDAIPAREIGCEWMVEASDGAETDGRNDLPILRVHCIPPAQWTGGDVALAVEIQHWTGRRPRTVRYVRATLPPR